MHVKKLFLAMSVISVLAYTSMAAFAANEPVRPSANKITERVHKMNRAINTDEVVNRFLQRAGFDVRTDDPILKASMAGLAMKDSNAVQRIFSAFIEGALDIAEMMAKSLFE